MIYTTHVETPDYGKEFSDIKYAISNIMFYNLVYDEKNKVIQGNAAAHKIATYVETNYVLREKYNEMVDKQENNYFSMLLDNGKLAKELKELKEENVRLKSTSQSIHDLNTALLSRVDELKAENEKLRHNLEAIYYEITDENEAYMDANIEPLVVLTELDRITEAEFSQARIEERARIYDKLLGKWFYNDNEKVVRLTSIIEIFNEDRPNGTDFTADQPKFCEGCEQHTHQFISGGAFPCSHCIDFSHYQARK